MYANQSNQQITNKTFLIIIDNTTYIIRTL